MVHVAHSRHSVNLEILIGAEGRRLLNRAPVREGGLRIVEPLVRKLAHGVGIGVAHTFGDL